ncbi:hypothetical protein LB566_03435 [Mesorhizobium sp. CA13]|uniref:hypothetical protein n=1 Tax=Mesorhizobium sp. CA13 TaxID=2876643 RepID=UPI001CCCAF8A|nr:hypothetical protein [Mesorhizobium sp. CA13]MBZ9852835.1 hypothetical protein [Mesorhizobium sp. CA13]
MAISLRGSVLATALLASAISTSAQSFAAILPARPAVTASRAKKRRKLVPKLTPAIWRGREAAKKYMSRRSFPAGRTSTLKKTAKRLRLQAGGL